MDLSVLGVSCHTAGVDVREAFALGAEKAPLLLRRLRSEDVLAEAMVLNTCNRTELYVVHDHPGDIADYLCRRAAEVKGVASLPTEQLYRRDEPDAVRHLFRVAAGLDSQILGESQILGQIKSAYQSALRERTAGFLLNRLLHSAFHVGKRVRTETALGRGAGGIAQAAVEMARRIFDGLDGRTVLLIGAGQTAELAARAALEAGATGLIVANRTLDNARRIASAVADEADALTRCPAMRRKGQAHSPRPARRPIETTALGLEGLSDALAKADLVISSTGSPEPILTADAHAGPLAADGRPVVMIDIAVPRDIEPALGDLPGVHLHNIDDLDQLVSESLQQRQAQAPLAEAIVAEEVDRFNRWLKSRQVAPTIALLHKRLDALRADEIERYGRKFDADTREQLDRFTQSLLGKLLHQPTEYLRRIAERGDASDTLAAADTIRKMFDLDSLEDQP